MNPSDPSRPCWPTTRPTWPQPPYGSIYAITTRADRRTVRRVNQLEGRPADQVGSITRPPQHLADTWDLDRLPPGYACPAKRDLLAESPPRPSDELLYATSANRSRHLPASLTRTRPLPGLATRTTHPSPPPSWDLHTTVQVVGDDRVRLVLEGHGSLPAAVAC